MTGDCQPREENGQRARVDYERYRELLRKLVQAARTLKPAPDAVVANKRSGLFPAVYLSHQLGLPMLSGSEAKSFPFPKLQRPLLVDTTAWSGETLRRTANRLKHCGVEEVPVLVMFARAKPPPNVHPLHYLELSEHIVHFWYEDKEDWRGNAAPQE